MPVLLMMLFILLVFSTGAFWAVVCALALYNGAIIGEALRAGIASLPRGQREAGSPRPHAAAVALLDRVPAGVPPDAADHHRPARRAAEGHLARLHRRLQRAAPRDHERRSRASSATATCSRSSSSCSCIYLVDEPLAVVVRALARRARTAAGGRVGARPAGPRVVHARAEASASARRRGMSMPGADRAPCGDCEEPSALAPTRLVPRVRPHRHHRDRGRRGRRCRARRHRRRRRFRRAEGRPHRAHAGEASPLAQLNADAARSCPTTRRPPRQARRRGPRPGQRRRSPRARPRSLVAEEAAAARERGRRRHRGADALARRRAASALPAAWSR